MLHFDKINNVDDHAGWFCDGDPIIHVNQKAAVRHTDLVGLCKRWLG